jgi:hypothetical protein
MCALATGYFDCSRSFDRLRTRRWKRADEAPSASCGTTVGTDPIAARTLILLLIHNKSATRVSAQPHYGHARLPNQASAMGVLVRSSKRAQSTSREERCEVATAELFAREVPGPVRRASTHRRLGVGEKRIELTSHDDRRDE